MFQWFALSEFESFRRFFRRVSALFFLLMIFRPTKELTHASQRPRHPIALRLLFESEKEIIV